MNPSPLENVNIILSIASIIVSALVSFIVASVRMGVYKNKVDTNCSDISDIKRESKEVRDKVIACETSLKEREPLTRRKSPVSLTDRGTKVLNESAGAKFIDSIYEELKRKVEEKNPKTSYDVQEISKKIISSLGNDERLNPMKEYLFKEGLALPDLFEVLGIYLRDKILKEKNWNADDIDRFDPGIISNPKK